MGNKKITKRDNFNLLLTLGEVASNQQLVDFINHELEQLDKKSASGSKKQTANQIENEKIKNRILEVLTFIKRGTISDIQDADEILAELSNQKINSILIQLGDKGSKQVVKTYEKKKAYFELAKGKGE